MAKVSKGVATTKTADEDFDALLITAGTITETGSVAAGGLAEGDDDHVDLVMTHLQEERPAGLELVQTYELGAGDSTEILDTTGIKTLIAVTDGNAKWEVPSEDGSFFDFHVMTSQSQTATTNVGVVTADSMPPRIRLTDTSSSANTVTIYATPL